MRVTSGERIGDGGWWWGRGGTSGGEVVPGGEEEAPVATKMGAFTATQLLPLGHFRC